MVLVTQLAAPACQITANYTFPCSKFPIPNRPCECAKQCNRLTTDTTGGRQNVQSRLPPRRSHFALLLRPGTARE
ncbi:hypothetical protein CYMTET_22577 [Cymbomonas tetramitiformis]|uniref:Uncharacterized protein n=1 Tax=Cymbomonas tetramitiformis TaxID=36881 RepID=A0AAE0C564_9CHLO|nr:hypothetical protein CYMTET_41921 [Cymbomonas tetramitiformis]KAK3268949.1 hypothetical protein CYMTET_22577 [Cymbomonas tetramitiformis]